MINRLVRSALMVVLATVSLMGVSEYNTQHPSKVKNMLFMQMGGGAADIYKVVFSYLYVKEWTSVRVLSDYTSPVTSLSFTPNGYKIISGSQGSVCVHDLPFDQSDWFESSYEYGSSYCSPSGQVLVESTCDGRVYVWDKVTRVQKELSRTGNKNIFKNISLSYNGRRVALAANNNEIHLFNAAQGFKRSVLRGHTDLVASVCLSLNGKTLVSSSDDGTMRIWDTATGKQQKILKGDADSPICFSHDGKKIAYVSGLKMYMENVNTGEKTVVSDYADMVNDICFSPDGSLLASATDDEGVHLYDLVAGTKCMLKGHTGPVASLCFSHDGKSIASGGEDKKVCIWKKKNFLVSD